MAPTNWNEMDKDELYEQAQRLNIKGRSKMDKDELIAALSADEADRRDHLARVAVLTGLIGDPIIIRSNPSVDEIKDFVRENNRRAEEGERNPDGYPAVRVLEAVYYESEAAFRQGDVDSQGEEIDLSDVL